MLSKWRKLSEGWRIFWAGVLFTSVIIPLVFYLYGKISVPIPGTCVMIYGKEYNLSLDDVKKDSPVRVVVHAVRFPPGVESLDDAWLPLTFSNDLPKKGQKTFTIFAHNKGDNVDENIRISIHFARSAIVSIDIDHEDRVSVVEGGACGASFVVLEIKRLSPGERQTVELLSKVDSVDSVTVWSERLGNIDDVYIFDLIYEL